MARQVHSTTGAAQRAALAAAVLVVLAWAPAHAQQARPSDGIQTAPEDSTLLEGLTVTAPADPRAVEKRVETFVSGVTLRPENWSIARWHAPVCPLVAGLSKHQGEMVLARLSQVARKAGAPLETRKCEPNLYVVVTAEPERLLRAWKARNRNLFGYDLPARVTRFLKTDRPIRVWYNAGRLSPDGATLAQSAGFNNSVTNLRAKATRLESNGLRSFYSIIVVVDANRLAGLKIFQLADYAAMVSLTELDLDRGIGETPSILRLFEPRPGGEAGPQRLSAFDKAFLEALYATSPRNKGQKSSIAVRVLESLAKLQEPEPAS